MLVDSIAALLGRFAFRYGREEQLHDRIADVLGVKREQIEGVRNPTEGLIERIDTGENQLRRLAEAYLQGRGLKVPASNVTTLEPA